MVTVTASGGFATVCPESVEGSPVEGPVACSDFPEQGRRERVEGVEGSGTSDQLSDISGPAA